MRENQDVSKGREQDWPEEPWVSDPEFPGEPEFVAADGKTYSFHDDEPQYARALACVNALATIQNPAAVRDALTAMKAYRKAAEAELLNARTEMVRTGLMWPRVEKMMGATVEAWDDLDEALGALDQELEA